MWPGIASPRTRVRRNSNATTLSRGAPSSESMVAPCGRYGRSRSSSTAKVIAATFNQSAVRNGIGRILPRFEPGVRRGSTVDRMHDDGYFGEPVAARYDSTTGVFAPDAIEPVVDVLAELAGGGAALEFAIGTGRIAVPLAARGVPVHGIELSKAMVARLRAKPGGERIPVTIGDMSTTRWMGPSASSTSSSTRSAT